MGLSTRAKEIYEDLGDKTANTHSMIEMLDYMRLDIENNGNTAKAGDLPAIKEVSEMLHGELKMWGKFQAAAKPIKY